MNKKTIIAFVVIFLAISIVLIRDEFYQYAKMSRLYEDGIKTTAALLEYKVKEKKARGLLKYDQHIFIYEYFDESNIQHQYRITHGKLHFKEQLKKGSISITYNPRKPDEAIESSKLKIISDMEFSFNITISIALSLFSSFMILLLINTTFPISKWKSKRSTP